MNRLPKSRRWVQAAHMTDLELRPKRGIRKVNSVGKTLLWQRKRASMQRNCKFRGFEEFSKPLDGYCRPGGIDLHAAGGASQIVTMKRYRQAHRSRTNCLCSLGVKN